MRQKDTNINLNLENRMRFFVDRYSAESYTTNPYYGYFLRNSENKLNNSDSFNRFKAFLSYPLETNLFCETIFNDLSKVFSAQNKFFDAEFITPELKNTAKIDFKYFSENVWQTYKTKPNSILVVLPIGDEEQEILTVHSENIVEISADAEHIHSLKFKYSGIFIKVNEFSYEIYNENNELTNTIPHELGETPAVWVSDYIFNSDNPCTRGNVFYSVLSLLEELQFLQTLKKIVTPSAFYQNSIIFRNYERCNYEDSISYCANGYLHAKENNEQIISNENGAALPCPLCNKNVGVGSVIQVKLPRLNEIPIVENVLRFVAPDTTALAYGDTYIASLEDKIYSAIVGTTNTLNPKLNHNETAYKYNIEGQKAVLLRLKKNFERVITETTNLLWKLKYGKNFINCFVDLGTDFLLTDSETAFSEMNVARANGVLTELQLTKQVVNQKFENNPAAKNRARIIELFKPFNEPLSDIEDSYISGAVSEFDYFKMKYLDNFIANFELKYPLETADVASAVELMNKEFTIYYKNIVKPEKEQKNESTNKTGDNHQ